MPTRPQRRVPLAVTAAALALGLTACSGGDGSVSAPVRPEGSASASAAGTSASASVADGVEAEPGPSVPPAGTPEPDGPSSAGESPDDDGGGRSPQALLGTRAPEASDGSPADGTVDNAEEGPLEDSCTMGQLTLNVRPDGSRRIIEVANTGTTACVLDLIPDVGLGNRGGSGRERNLRPLVPGGIGGPDHTLPAGAKAYAVLDLAPGGRAGGARKRVNEMNILLSPAHMAAADVRSVPLGSRVRVSVPRLGLYDSTVDGAVASMRQADTRQR
ncbi:DUF4232 domain-containing protein [Streptomyces sp. SHP 1-2]|uniref:DUF4232 domain-containing protein n=1 Tax=Streptomyces sp. SHP 1-2 TaxID=2769489 RepID=UPI002237B671|nr:DUF4232 domain-containing protein [Streptomyces sp. SHP 1-2]MCW5253683.1 DUF4232 domain-containing protein [Streptomyces sp. SHP 1-2]